MIKDYAIARVKHIRAQLSSKQSQNYVAQSYASYLLYNNKYEKLREHLETCEVLHGQVSDLNSALGRSIDVLSEIN